MISTSLTYVLTHPSAVGCTAERPAALLLLVVLPFFWYWAHPRSRSATIVRVVVWVVVSAALAGAGLTVHVPDHRLSVVAALDLSESVTPDGQRWMRRYVDEFSRKLAPGDNLAVLTFAGDTRIVQPEAPPAPLRALPTPAQRSATDLERALITAGGLLPSHGARRLLLLTDGNETRGDARRQSAPLRAAGIRVDAAIPPAGEQLDVHLDKVVAAPVVAEDDPFPLRIVAYNHGPPSPAVLSLFFDGQIVESAEVPLIRGLNAIEIPYRLTGQGSHRVRAQLRAAFDAVPGNDFREIGITVSGRLRVLLATPRERSTLGAVLSRKGLAVDTVRFEQLPQGLSELLPYHCVILEEPVADRVPTGHLAVLERYVQEFGGGLLVIGGGATFGDAALRSTPLARLLPVTLEPRRPKPKSREPLALFLVIDRSNSMGYNSRIGTLRDGEKLRYAKEAALAVVRQLKDHDRVGVIAFDSQPHEIAPLRPLRENRTRLEQDIPRLVENGGTDFLDALIGARDQLAAARVSRRHIILLTDGDTNRAAADHYPLVEELTAAGISVTTIRIGDNDVNLQLLQDLSAKTQGEFYHVQNVEQLPDLMLRDTTRALGALAGDGEHLVPQVASRSEALRDLAPDDLPALRDYAYAQLKSGADLPLYVARADRRDPLLAAWHYGLGRVAAFTADLADDAEAWLAWPSFSKFWSQLTHWVAHPHTPLDLAIEVHRRDGQAELTVRTFTDQGTAVLLARLHVDEDDVRELSLAPAGPRRYSALLPPLSGGIYPITFVRRDGAVVQETATHVVVPEEDDAAQEEQRHRAPNIALLTELTAHTGGAINPSAHDLAARAPGARRITHPLDHLLLPLAMVCFLVDIALRRRPESQGRRRR